ncbi:MAG: hypothetical protein JXN61_05305 [Sedimentisphaerales bacterium]|nr:hypothetical protein [Sedimentisphaerales bacterium]
MEFNETIQTVQEPPTRLLTCSKCGESKPPDEFFKKDSNKTGRASMCKKCTLSIKRELYAARRDNRGKDAEADERYAGPPGEYADEQVASVLKALAALEIQVKETKANAKMRIEAIRADGEKIVDDITGRIESMRQELKRMCARLATGKKPYSAFCRYGRAHYYDGELSVTLFPTVALADEEKL